MEDIDDMIPSERTCVGPGEAGEDRVAFDDEESRSADKLKTK